MSKNIENGKKFVTECQNHKEEENSMNENSSTIENESTEEFWERMVAEAKFDSFRRWDEIEGYNKFRSYHEMEDPEPFFALLIGNEELRNNRSIRDIKKMATKYAKECLDAEEATREKTSARVGEALRQRGINPVFERSTAMNEEEIKDFMNFVREAEWVQYIEQTAEEIEQMLMSNCSTENADSIIERTIEECERCKAEYSCRVDLLF